MPPPAQPTPTAASLRAVRDRLGEAVACKQRLLEGDHAERIAAATQAIVDAYRAGGKVLLCGNGGSAADSQHVAAELVGRFGFDRDPLAAIALTTDTSALTAIGNDYSFAEVFERQVRGLARPGDVVIGLSTSGGSENVARALRAATELGATTVALTGAAGGAVADAADHPLRVPADTTPRIQEAHILVAHVICELVEDALFGDRRP